MGASPVDWLPGLVVLAVGLVLGGVLVWRMRAVGPAVAVPLPPSGLERRDLLGKRDALFRQLAELEDTAAKRSPTQLARERYALELDAARVLRELDRLPDAAPAATPETSKGSPAPTATTPAAAGGGGRPALRGFLWSVGSMAALASLVFLVTRSARPRESGAPPTGEPGMSVSASPADPGEARLRAQIEQAPDDLEARLDLARLLLERDDMMGVWNETQEVLARSPGQPRALAYQAFVRLAMGQSEVALQMFEQALAADPDLIDAYAPLSAIQMQMGRREEAARTMAEAKRRFPAQAEAIERFEAQMLASTGESPASSEANPHATVPAPEGTASAAQGQMAAPGPATAAAREVAGVLDLDPTLAAPARGGVLFLIVRGSGVQGGPPLAVQRLSPSSFPMRFAIGERDSMTGAPLPDSVRVEARLDGDGDPSTRPPTDPQATADPVAIGTSDLTLVLRAEN